MFCRNCGEAMNDNQAICLKCGVKKDVGNNFCANCGATMNPGAEICMNCGVAVKKEGNLNGQDKTVLAVLAILIGGLGIHNFMMGETKKGSTKKRATPITLGSKYTADMFFTLRMLLSISLSP